MHCWAGNSYDYVSFLEQLFSFQELTITLLFSVAVCYESIQILDWVCQIPIIIIVQTLKYSK